MGLSAKTIVQKMTMITPKYYRPSCSGAENESTKNILVLEEQKICAPFITNFFCILLPFLDGRAEDCHLAAPCSIPASAKSKLRSLNMSFALLRAELRGTQGTLTVIQFDLIYYITENGHRRYLSRSCKHPIRYINGS